MSLKNKKGDYKQIGYWRKGLDESTEAKDAEEEAESLIQLPYPTILPKPHDPKFIDKCKQWIGLDREMQIYTAELMRHGLYLDNENYREFSGYSKCKLCDQYNGCSEYIYNGYIFPISVFHYIVVHNIMIDKDFEDMIVNNKLMEVRNKPAKSFLSKFIESMSALRFI